MNRIEVINWLIKKYRYKSYLEIGTHNNVTFNSIDIKMFVLNADYGIGIIQRGK